MPNGANFVHKQLRTELEDYIKSQYFGKTPILLSALSSHMDDEGLFYQKPFIESSPAYVAVQNGIETAAGRLETVPALPADASAQEAAASDGDALLSGTHPEQRGA